MKIRAVFFPTKKGMGGTGVYGAAIVTFFLCSCFAKSGADFEYPMELISGMFNVLRERNRHGRMSIWISKTGSEISYRLQQGVTSIASPGW